MPPLSPAEDHVGKAELGEAGETPRREQIPMPLSVFVFLTVVMTTIREPPLCPRRGVKCQRTVSPLTQTGQQRKGFRLGGAPLQTEGPGSSMAGGPL